MATQLNQIRAEPRLKRYPLFFEYAKNVLSKPNSLPYIRGRNEPFT